MVCVLCGGVEVCYKYGVCTVLCCGNVLLVWFFYCVVVWHRILCMVCVLDGGVAACH